MHCNLWVMSAKKSRIRDSELTKAVIEATDTKVRVCA